MDETRLDPDQLLKSIRQSEKFENRGRLKIFFGYAAGVGKTYSMLKAAHAARRHDIDVVIGYVEPHQRPETIALVNGIEELPRLEISYKGITLYELDIDAVLARKPKIVLVDELAHTNSEGCRHAKRYQDVEEILKAGIDVYTTVNVQHIESLNDMVASITGVTVRERIPDHVFDNADQVELVDIEPAELIDRLNAGKIYKKQQAQKALVNFFDVKNLTALREIALRRCADRVNKMAEKVRAAEPRHYYTDEHILVGLSSSPSNPKIIRTAARMAEAFKGSFTALFIETSDFKNMSESDRNRLRSNMHLSEQLGATVEAMYGDDIAVQISEFARLSGVSKIVIGRNNAHRKHFWGRQTLAEKLALAAPNLDIYIIPDAESPPYNDRRLKKTKFKLSLPDVIRSTAMLLVATLIGFLFKNLGFSEANIITVYILGVLFTAITTSHRIYSMVSSVISIMAFNLFFTEPALTFKMYDSGYPLTLLITLLAAFITSSLAVKLKEHARQSAATAYRTKILLETNQLLQKAGTQNSIASVTADQLIKLLNKDIVIYLSENGELKSPKVYPCSDDSYTAPYVSDNERAVAAWVYKNNKHAGATTNTLGNSKCLYLAIRVNENVYGVVGIALSERPLDSYENSIVLSILGECALALEHYIVLKEREETAVLAKNEQLRANLLRSISHDLRTPLTSISGNAGILLESGDSMDSAKKRQLYSNIYDDSLWLIGLVENLLSVTKIEAGAMSLNFSTELIDDVINEALHHLGQNSAEHSIVVKPSGEYLLAKMDSRLISQVVINIVDNALKYTPPGSEIVISTVKQGEYVAVSIADNGEGISDDAKPRVFDMFYTSDKKSPDSHRSLGLGLALCRSIISAHGGDIAVFDNQPHGAVFRFTLPITEVTLHE